MRWRKVRFGNGVNACDEDGNVGSGAGRAMRRDSVCIVGGGSGTH